MHGALAMRISRFVLLAALAAPFGLAGCPAPEGCNDNVDNDGDSLIDCADPDCAATVRCSTDDVGNFDAPTPVTLDLSRRIDINPGDTDEDCFSFTLNAATRLHIVADDTAFGAPDGRCGTSAFDPDVA